MNRLLQFGAVLAIVATLAVGAAVRAADKDSKKPEADTATKNAPPDITGKWVLELKSPRGTQESQLKFEKTGDKYVGAMTDPRGQSTALKDITYKDGDLSFQIAGERQGQKFELDYTAKVTGDTLKGKMTVKGRNFSINLNGRRESPIEGLWKVSFVLDSGQKLQSSIKIKQKGDKFVGEFVGITGKKSDAKEVTFKDGVLSFDVDDQVEKGDILFHYTGKVVAEKVNGNVSWAGDGSTKLNFKFEAEKSHTKTADVAGTWKLKVPVKNGPTFEPTVKFTQTGGAVTGTYTGEQGETPVADGLVLGDELTFEVNKQKDGKSYKLRYQGKVDGDKVKGAVDYNFDGITGYYDFVGQRVTPAATTKP
jgi:hypothetical protein